LDMTYFLLSVLLFFGSMIVTWLICKWDGLLP
jgi:hypothetical protein